MSFIKSIACLFGAALAGNAFWAQPSWSENAPSPASAHTGFDILVLGARGGVQDGNLSAYMVSPHGDHRAILCDAGTVVNGLNEADHLGKLIDFSKSNQTALTPAGYVLHHVIQGYLISHAHLDHIAGLAISAPDDTPKPLYGLQSTLDDLSQYVFNWHIWPNFADHGNAPFLKTYTYQPLIPTHSQPLQNTAMNVTAWPLSHGPVTSTAFLIKSGSDALLYLCDTGPDPVEKTHRLQTLWRAVASDVQKHQLKAIIMEASYDNSRPDNALFGHLTPHWVLKSLHDLAQETGDASSLQGLTVVISHIKYTLNTGAKIQETIKRQLETENDLGVNFVIAEQGLRLHVH